MTTTFDNRAALEKAIESCSNSVRALREKMHDEEEAVEMEDVAKEVQRLMGLRKELQRWIQTKSEDQKTNQHEEETPETGNDSAEPMVVGSKLEQRAVKLESHVAKANEKLLILETKVAQIERTKNALTYLNQVRTSAEEKVETLVDQTTEIGVIKSLKKKKKNKKVMEAKKVATNHLGMTDDTDQVANLTIQLEAERMKVLEVTQTAKKLQKSVDALTEEKRKIVAKLTAESKAGITKSEQASDIKHSDDELEDGLLNVQDKLDQTITTIVQEKTGVVANLTGELKKEHSEPEQANQLDQKVYSDPELSVMSLVKEKVELQNSLQAAENITNAVRDELSRLKKELSEIKDKKETRETHLGKLWKNIEELQLENKMLKEKNLSIKAKVQKVRAEAERYIAEISSYDHKTEMLNAEIESAKIELDKSKKEAEILQHESEKLQNEVSVSKSIAANSEERIRTLEKDLEVSTAMASKNVTELENLRKLNKEAEATKASFAERIQALENEIKRLKQSELEVAAECDVLRQSTKDSERVHKNDIEKLMSQLVQLQSVAEGKDGKFEAELSQAQEIAKVAVAEKELLTSQLLEMKDNMVQLKLKHKKELGQVSDNGLQLKRLAMDLEARTAEVKKEKALNDDLQSQRSIAADQLQDLRGVAATNEELLKKARASLLESNEELKEARANALKWKNSAQAAKTLMNAKIADFESANKQLKKARADASSASTARSQLSLSLQAKEKKLAKTKQELVAVRKELAEILAAMDAERTQSKQEHMVHVLKLRERSDNELAQLSSQVHSHRVMLAVLLPVLVAVSVYAFSH
ncbi:hypothetical protein Plhal710r2_c021g0087801 [Plasmopara halstedii]